jgi:hypothetical protein
LTELDSQAGATREPIVGRVEDRTETRAGRAGSRRRHPWPELGART